MTADLPSHDPRPAWGEVGIHGIHRGRTWDAVATVEADLPGDELVAVVLAGSSVLEVGPEAVELGPLVAALSLEPPYRLEAVRRGASLWAVGAIRIDVVELTQDPGADELEIAFDGRERSIRADGSPTFATVPELERLGERSGGPYVVRASRIAGSVWEVEVSPL